MFGYLDAIEPHQSVIVTLDGQKVEIPRARLGLHLRLAQLVEDFKDAAGYEEMSWVIRAYFHLLGVSIERAKPVEILTAFVLVRALNNWRWTPVFMKSPAPKKDELIAWDYPDRGWAWVVHKLASRYGWTGEYILSLWLEEATAYLQEVLISEQLEMEERHSLSELSYHYDKIAKVSRYVPLPRPEWMQVQIEAKPVKMLRSMMPYGVVDLENKPVIYH